MDFTTAPTAYLDWYAAQGNRAAQKELANRLEQSGDHKAAAFWKAKAEGDPRFTMYSI